MATMPESPAMGPATRAPLGLVLRAAVRCDVNVANVTAGMSAILYYMFGATPLFLGVVEALAIPSGLAASWFFIIFLTSGVVSLLLSAWYRQPIAMGWSFPALVFIGTVGTRYPLEELIGASLVAGVAVVALGLLGAGDRLMRLLPLPLVLGMFAGSILHYAIGIFAELEAQPIVVGAALAGFVATRAINHRWLPPIAGAVVSGTLAAVLAGETQAGQLAWGTPSLELLPLGFGIGSALAVSLPLVILVLWTGNVPGLGVLASQGYRAPVTAVTVATGVASIVNALFGGHPASLQRIGAAMLAGDDAGPRHQRYVASLIAGLGCVVIAFGATTVIGLVGVLPASLIASVAGLAIVRPLMDALEKTVATELRTGAFFALAIAASPLTLFGIGSAFWAIAGGYAVSLAIERPALRASLRASASPQPA